MRLYRALILSIVLGAVPAAAAPDFAARLSDASSAMEYWDVTSWFPTGQRFSARFLITNQGPGTRTAAAVGHLLLPNGEMVSISYGRLSDRWTLSDDGRRLKVASAVLDMTGSAIRVEVDSDKRGIKLAIEFAAAAPIAVNPAANAYAIDVLMPSRATGSYMLRGMAMPVALDGVAALTHTSMEKDETDIVMQRAELFGRAEDTAVYVNHITLGDGERRSSVVRRRADTVDVSNDASLRYNDWPKVSADANYGVATGWVVTDKEMTTNVSLKREYLRWDPLDILPQPFRLLVSLRSAPRRVWSDAHIRLTPVGGSSPALIGTGIAVVTFAQTGIQQ